MKKKFWILLSVVFVLILGFIAYFFVLSQPSSREVKDLSSHKTSSIEQSSKLISKSSSIKQSSEPISKENSSSSQTASSGQSSEEDSQALNDSEMSSVYSQAAKVMTIQEARQKMTEAGINSSDFSNLDIAKYINQANEQQVDFISYLKSQGF